MTGLFGYAAAKPMLHLATEGLIRLGGLQVPGGGAVGGGIVDYNSSLNRDHKAKEQNEQEIIFAGVALILQELL